MWQHKNKMNAALRPPIIRLFPSFSLSILNLQSSLGGECWPLNYKSRFSTVQRKIWSLIIGWRILNLLSVLPLSFCGRSEVGMRGHYGSLNSPLGRQRSRQQVTRPMPSDICCCLWDPFKQQWYSLFGCAPVANANNLCLLPLHNSTFLERLHCWLYEKICPSSFPFHLVIICAPPPLLLSSSLSLRAPSL